MVNIYIWGTGKVAKKVVASLDSNICDVKGFIDNNINIALITNVIFDEISPCAIVVTVFVTVPISIQLKTNKHIITAKTNTIYEYTVSANFSKNFIFLHIPSSK